MKTEDNFNLSEKMNDIESMYDASGIPSSSFFNEDEDYRWFWAEDVKEFIRRLKGTLKEGVARNNVLPLDWAFDRIDTLAGDDLK